MRCLEWVGERREWHRGSVKWRSVGGDKARRGGMMEVGGGRREREIREREGPDGSGSSPCRTGRSRFGMQ